MHTRFRDLRMSAMRLPHHSQALGHVTPDRHLQEDACSIAWFLIWSIMPGLWAGCRGRSMWSIRSALNIPQTGSNLPFLSVYMVHPLTHEHPTDTTESLSLAKLPTSQKSQKKIYLFAPAAAHRAVAKLPTQKNQKTIPFCSGRSSQRSSRGVGQLVIESSSSLCTAHHMSNGHSFAQQRPSSTGKWLCMALTPAPAWQPQLRPAQARTISLSSHSANAW
jgi:hypothetical protein